MAKAQQTTASSCDPKLYFGDNLEILREHIKDESVDLVYLDPPFNSNATYNVLFKSPRGQVSHAQISAFEDTWHWGEQAEAEFAQLLACSNTDVSEMIQGLRRLLGENDMMAYLTMMTNRLLELHRVLKPTGNLFLHCDPTASHYLKVVLDSVFSIENFRNEVIWKRQSAHNDATTKFASVTDTLLFYSKSKSSIFNVVRLPLNPDYVVKFYRHKDANGRLYRLSDMSAPEGGGMARINPRSGKPNGWYKWRGYEPPQRGWRYSQETMQRLHDEGRIHYPENKSGRPSLKRFLDENKGAPVPNIWDDIPPVHSANAEGLGYPTQKPLALLERIIQAASNEHDLVLDPFCGCGTAIHAAQIHKRNWIGIDVTHLAISLIEKRMRDAFPALTFDVHGTPKDYEGARELAFRDKYEFQYWACSLVNAQPHQNRRKGADSGIDGLIYFQHDTGQIGKIVVSVKGGDNVGVGMVRDLGHVVQREKASIGLFVTLSPPSKPMVAEAAGAGFYVSPINGARFPKLQILTIDGLLSGVHHARYPRLDAGGLTFKKAKRGEINVVQKALNFEDPGSIMERRMAVTCTLVNRLADEPHFGRTKLAKLFFLADASENLDLGTTYYRKAAGPLDVDALYNVETGLEAFAIKHRYLSVEKTGKKITYRRGPQLAVALDEARKVLGKKRTAVNRLIDLFRKLDTDQCEIVATLYACWNDFLIEGKKCSDEEIVSEFLNSWNESKRRFSAERLMKALDWMRRNKLVPAGLGSHTRAT